ncbi:bifunctional nuclease family protein [Candidatus Uhrbacteria bacterium]|nr:bifunctional nuclease family protein [Candidatus Uhrbacteria bacterium]
MHADIKVHVKRVFLCKNGSVIFIGDEAKTFPLYSGIPEGAILQHVLAKKPTERPLAHTAWLMSLERCGHPPTRAMITKIIKGTFYAELALQIDRDYTGHDLIVDCRPSDMLIIATLANLPIHVAQDVWDAMENHTNNLGLSDKDLATTWPFSNFVNPPTIYVGVTPEEVEVMEAQN